MRWLTAWWAFLHLILATTFWQQQELVAVLNSPRTGEAVEGLTPITGSVGGELFSSYQIAFSSTVGEPTWFMIERGDTAVEDDLLAEWDTNSLTDGDYQIRLQVFGTDGSVMEAFVEAIRVRNYTPIETDTPAPTATPAADATTTVTPTLISPTATALAANPAEISPEKVNKAITWGAIIAILGMGLLGLYAASRK